MGKLNIASLGVRRTAKAAETASKSATPMTGKQMFGIGLASGVTTGTVNNVINQKYIQKGHQKVKAAYYRRKLANGAVVKVQKAVNHGVGVNQTAKNKGGA